MPDNENKSKQTSFQKVASPTVTGRWNGGSKAVPLGHSAPAHPPSKVLGEMLFLKEGLEAELAKTEAAIAANDLDLLVSSCDLDQSALWTPPNLWQAAARHIRNAQMSDTERVAVAEIGDDELFRQLCMRLQWLRELEMMDETGRFTALQRCMFSGTSQTSPSHFDSEGVVCVSSTAETTATDSPEGPMDFD